MLYIDVLIFIQNLKSSTNTDSQIALKSSDRYYIRFIWFLVYTVIPAGLGTVCM